MTNQIFTTKVPQKKLTPKLIAIDLDDTLLTDDLKISDYTVRILHECVKRGIYVVLCSGRLEKGVLDFAKYLNISEKQEGRYIISFNGCSVFDLHEKKQIYKASVPVDIQIRANEIAEEMGLHTEVFTSDKIYYQYETEWTIRDPKLNKVKSFVKSDYLDFISKNSFPKMLIPGEPEKLQELQEKLKLEFLGRANISISKPYFLELHRIGSSKGEAISMLANHIGIGQDTLCFGDSMNDESMIRNCRWGVAMINARQEIKEMADFITQKDNNNDGVANFIESFVL